MIQLPLGIEARMERLTDRSGDCWIWKGCKRSGYGYIHFRGFWKNKKIGAHRVSYMLHKGQIPDGYFVCHHCDNRACVNPDHLFVGTSKDNLADMTAKGRRVNTPHSMPGEKHPNASVSDKVALEIYAAYKSGLRGYRTVGKKFGVSGSVVRGIVRATGWKHLGLDSVDPTPRRKRKVKA